MNGEIAGDLELAGSGGLNLLRQEGDGWVLLGVEEARAICGRDRWVGVSTHTLDQVTDRAKLR